MFNENGDESWIWLVLVLFLFGGNGFGANGTNYTLTNDMSMLSRQMETGFDGLRQQSTQIANGLCDGFYTQAQLVNGVNSNIATLGSTMQSCCCGIERAIDGVNYNMQTQARDIIDNNNSNTKAIMDFLVSDKIATLQSENNALRLSASQCAQNEYLVSRLAPTPIPAYTVSSPYCNCGNYYNGTTIQ